MSSETKNRKVVINMSYEVTNIAVLADVAKEVIDVMQKHGIRSREVDTVLQAVKEQLSSHPVQEAKAYANSR